MIELPNPYKSNNESHIETKPRQAKRHRFYDSTKRRQERKIKTYKNAPLKSSVQRCENCMDRFPYMSNPNHRASCFFVPSPSLSRGNMSSRWMLLPALASYFLSLWLCFLTCSNGASDNTYTLFRRVWQLGPSCCFPSEEHYPLNQHAHRHTHTHTQPNWDENKSTFIVIVVDVSGDAGGFFGV